MDIPAPPPGFEPVGGGMPPPPPGFLPVETRGGLTTNIPFAADYKELPPPPPPGFEPVQEQPKGLAAVPGILKQAGQDILNIVPSMIHGAKTAVESSQLWQSGERTPENAANVASQGMYGMKLGRTPGVVSAPAEVTATKATEPTARITVNRMPEPPPGFEPVPADLGAAATTAKEPVAPVTKPEVAAVADDLNRLRQSGVADRAEIANRMEATPPEFKDPALQEKFYHHIESGSAPTGETIRGAAVKLGEQVHEGPNHFQVLKDVAAKRGVDVMDVIGENPVDGFVTSKGRFVDRAEAGKIANANDQVQKLGPKERKASEGLGANELKPPSNSALSPAEQAMFDQHIQPMRAELSELYNKVKQYGGEDMVADPTYVHRIAKGHAPAYDTLSGDAADPITGTRGLNRTTSALQGRKFFALEDETGNRFVVSGGDGASHIWTKGKPTRMTTELELRPGTEIELGGKTFDVKQATTNEIEANTAVRYHKNAAVNTADALVRMREVARNLDYLEKVKSDLFDQGRAARVVGNRPIPEGFAETKIPQLRGWAFDKKIAAAFDDFYKPGLEGLEGLRKVNQFATASLFWQPLPHIENVAWHWYTARGFDWVRPGPMRNFATDATRAIKETVEQGPEYQRLLREGNGVIYGGIKQARFFENLGKTFDMETQRQWGQMKPVFDKLGLKTPYEATAWWYDKMRNTLWAANDMFMLHRVFELERKGLSPREAIKEAEKHIPNYRIPSEVLGSRQVSRIMQEPAFLVFMRYHYGQWKSYAHQITDLAVGTTKERVEAIGSLAATGFGMLVIIPTLNYILQKLTGDPEAKKLMRGSLSIPDMALQLALGDKTGGESVSNVFTFAPVTKEILQQGYGRDTFTGANLGGPVPRLEHALKTTIAPYGTLAQATDSNPGSRTAGRLAFDTLAGAKNTSERSRGMQEYFKGRREKEDERRYQRPNGPLTKGYKAAKDYVSKSYRDAYKGPGSD